MARNNQITIKFTGDEKDLLRALQNVTAELETQGAAAGGTSKEVTKLEQRLEGIVGVADKIKTVSDDIWNPFKQGAIEAAAAAEKNFGVLVNQLEKRGTDLGITVNEIQTFADGLADATLTSQEAVLQASRSLLTFDEVGGDTFFRTITVAQDAAEVLGTDLVGAVETFGEVLQNPKNEVSALSVVLENFDDTQIEYVKNLQEAGDLAAAQEYILGKLEERFGGAGLAAAQGYAGAIDTFGENVNDVSRIVGKEFLPLLTDLTNAGSSVVQTFIDLDPVLQSVLIQTVSFTSAIASAVLLTNKLRAAIKAKTAIDILELGLIGKKIIANETLTFSQKKTIVLAKAQIATLGPLLAKFALVTAAVAALAIAYDSLSEEGKEFKKNSTAIADAQRELAREIGGVGRAAELAVGPTKKFYDIFGFEQEKRLNDIAIAARDVGINASDLAGDLLALGDTEEEIAAGQKAFKEGLREIDDAISKLDENEIGTELYQQLKSELEASRKSLVGIAEAQGLVNEQAGERDRQFAEKQKQTQAEIDATEKQIELLEEKAEAEDLATSQEREDEAVALSRKREDAQAARQKANQELLAKRQEKFDEEQAKAQEAFNLEQEKLKDDREDRRLQLKRDRQDQDREEAEQFQDKLESDQESFAENEAKIKADFEEKLRQEQEQFNQDQRGESERFAESQRQKESAFNEQIEAEKDAAANARRKAEEELAKEISSRLEAQAQGFSEAGRQISEAGQLAAAESEEERQKLIDQFEDRRRQEAEVAALDLAGKVFSPEELINQAKKVADIQAIETEEDAKALADTLALIEAEQKAQQAEADKVAQLELQEELQAQQQAFESELESRKQAFAEEQQAAQKQFEEDQESARKEQEEQRQAAITAAEQERQTAREQFEAELDARRKERELALIELRRQREDDDREEAKAFQELLSSRQEDFNEEAEAKAEEFQEKQNAIQESFEESERDRQREFEDQQRAEQRAFNAEERAKDEASAERLAKLQERLQELSSEIESDVVEIRARKDGGSIEPGKTYLVGERNPEPLVFNSGKIAMVGTSGPELIRPTSAGYIYPNMAAMNSSGVLRELQGLRGDVGRSPRAIGSATYNIVGAQDPVKTTIKLQQERIRQQSRLSRL